MAIATGSMPARILLQVGEGVPNLIAEFTLEVTAVDPIDPAAPPSNAPPEATQMLTVDKDAVIMALLGVVDFMKSNISD